MKSNNERAVKEAKVPEPMRNVAHWGAAAATGLATFVLLWATNPSFVRGPATADATGVARYAVPRPSVLRVLAISVLAALLVAVAPLLIKWVTNK